MEREVFYSIVKTFFVKPYWLYIICFTHMGSVYLNRIFLIDFPNGDVTLGVAIIIIYLMILYHNALKNKLKSESGSVKLEDLKKSLQNILTNIKQLKKEEAQELSSAIEMTNSLLSQLDREPTNKSADISKLQQKCDNIQAELDSARQERQSISAEMSMLKAQAEESEDGFRREIKSLSDENLDLKEQLKIEKTQTRLELETLKQSLEQIDPKLQSLTPENHQVESAKCIQPDQDNSGVQADVHEVSSEVETANLLVPEPEKKEMNLSQFSEEQKWSDMQAQLDSDKRENQLRFEEQEKKIVYFQKEIKILSEKNDGLTQQLSEVSHNIQEKGRNILEIEKNEPQHVEVERSLNQGDAKSQKVTSYISPTYTESLIKSQMTKVEYAGNEDNGRSLQIQSDNIIKVQDDLGENADESFWNNMQSPFPADQH